jgi:ATP-dependent Clp protease ATP-binding subunit ClpC
VAGINNFTPKARHVLSLAQKQAERLRKPQISTEHLLIALVELEGSVASRVLRELGLEAETIKTVVDEDLGFGDYDGQITLSPGMQR